MVDSRRNRIKLFVVWAAVLVGLQLFGCSAAADITKTTVGLSVSEVAGERGWSGSATVPYSTGALKGHVSGRGQSAGGVVRGSFHAEAGVSHAGFDFIASIDGKGKGYSVRGIGGELAAGFAAESREVKVGAFSINVGLGFVGRNGGALAPPNALDELKSRGYDPEFLDVNYAGLASVNPPPRGVPFKLGNGFGPHAYSELSHPRFGRAKVEAFPEIIGDGAPLHQAKITTDSSFGVSGRLSVAVWTELVLALQGGQLFSELAAGGGLNINL